MIARASLRAVSVVCIKPSLRRRQNGRRAKLRPTQSQASFRTECIEKHAHVRVPAGVMRRIHCCSRSLQRLCRAPARQRNRHRPDRHYINV